METDEEVVRRVRGGDREAFGVLVDRYERYVRAIAWSLLPDGEDGQDAVQETFLRAYRALGDLADATRFRGWLAGIARNHCLDEVRRRAKALSMEDHPTMIEPDRGLEARELAERVLREIRELPEGYRVPLLLRYVDRRSYAAIAEATGDSVDAVRGLLYRGNRLLRARLAGIMEDR